MRVTNSISSGHDWQLLALRGPGARPMKSGRGMCTREYKHSVTDGRNRSWGPSGCLGILGGDRIHVNAGHWGGGGRLWPVSMLGRTGTLA